MQQQATCKTYHGALWVCENHIEKPWAGASDHPDACDCGAGAPCPECNPCDRDHPPKMPEGFRTILDKDGWRHGVTPVQMKVTGNQEARSLPSGEPAPAVMTTRLIRRLAVIPGGRPRRR